MAFIHKFRKDLPDSFLVLTVSKQDGSLNRNRKYLLEKVNKVLSYDRSSLGISLQDDQTLITEYLANGDTIIHATDKDFFNRSSVGFQNERHFISLDEDKWEFNLGIEKLLYQMFTYSKKDSAIP